ncbi:MAG: class II aldolase/adducin family protein [Opitutales bacterium]|nr:class II aldolase/adducin family protein [Opitutales bacterium]
MNETSLESLLDLCHKLGSVDLRLAILGEGNASVKLDDATFAVKGSGFSLATVEREGLAHCQFDALVPVVESDTPVPDSDAVLMASRTDKEGVKPSVEALFHSWLLTLPGVNYVAHTHPIAVGQILCSEHGPLFAEKRLVPDQVVCCQAQSLWVPYVDPGVELAREISKRMRKFIEEQGTAPNTILCQNHGLITLGSTADAAWGAMIMAEKCAEMFVGAASISATGFPEFMPSEEVERIAGRPDEEYRRKILNFTN